jgi:hypothetical protein
MKQRAQGALSRARSAVEPQHRNSVDFARLLGRSHATRSATPGATRPVAQQSGWGEEQRQGESIPGAAQQNEGLGPLGKPQTTDRSYLPSVNAMSVAAARHRVGVEKGCALGPRRVSRTMVTRGKKGSFTLDRNQPSLRAVDQSQLRVLPFWQRQTSSSSLRGPSAHGLVPW